VSVKMFCRWKTRAHYCRGNSRTSLLPVKQTRDCGLLFNVEIYGLFISCQHGGWTERGTEWRESRTDLWAERVGEDRRGEIQLPTRKRTTHNMQLRRHLLKSIRNYKTHTVRDLLVRKLCIGGWRFRRYCSHLEYVTHIK